MLRNSKAAVIIDDICVLKCFIGTKRNVSCPINTHTHTLWYLFSVFSGPLASTHTGQVALMIYIQNKLKFNRKLSNRTYFFLGGGGTLGNEIQLEKGKQEVVHPAGRT